MDHVDKKVNKKVKVKLIGLDGESVTSESPFIIVYSKDIVQFLVNIIGNIWKYNTNKIAKLINQFNIDSSNFYPAGYVYIKESHPTKLLMINKNIARQANNFKFLRDYYQGSLWISVSDQNNCDLLPLVFSPNKNNPTNTNIGIIIGNLPKKLKDHLNDFSFLRSNTNLKKCNDDYKKIGYTVQGELQMNTSCRDFDKNNINYII